MARAKVNSIDTNIGDRLKARRAELGITQQQLAKMLQISFQQVQKYEKGNNRIYPKRLLEISGALKVTTDYFLNGLLDYPPLDYPESDYPDDCLKRQYPGLSEDSLPVLEQTNDCLGDLINNFNKISHPEIKKHIFALVAILSEI